MKLEKIVLPAGSLKRVWVNKHHLPQFGGSSPTSPAWFVEVELPDEDGGALLRYQGFQVCILGPSVAQFDPTQPPEGPHAWVETTAEVTIDQAAEEAARP